MAQTVGGRDCFRQHRNIVRDHQHLPLASQMPGQSFVKRDTHLIHGIGRIKTSCCCKDDKIEVHVSRSPHQDILVYLLDTLRMNLNRKQPLYPFSSCLPHPVCQHSVLHQR